LQIPDTLFPTHDPGAALHPLIVVFDAFFSLQAAYVATILIARVKELPAAW
jgi:hypothetical protein